MEKQKWFNGATLENQAVSEMSFPYYRHVITNEQYKESGVKVAERGCVGSDELAARLRMRQEMMTLALHEGKPVDVLYFDDPKYYIPVEHFVMRVDPAVDLGERSEEMLRVAREAAGILKTDSNVNGVMLFGSLAKEQQFPLNVNLAVTTKRTLWKPFGNYPVVDPYISFRVPPPYRYDQLPPYKSLNYLHAHTFKDLINLARTTHTALDVSLGTSEDHKRINHRRGTGIVGEILKTGRQL